MALPLIGAIPRKQAGFENNPDFVKRIVLKINTVNLRGVYPVMLETRPYIRRKRRTDSNWSAIIAFSLLLIITAIGITGFMVIEGMTFTEAVYMTIITVATVGFKEVEPLSELGMWFTSFLIVISFGIFVYAVTSFARYVIDGFLRNYTRDRRMARKIRRLSNHVIICGYGRNGSQAAYDLSMHKVPFIVIENKPEIIETLRDSQDVLYIDGDATQDEVLQHAGIHEARAMITTLPEDADNLYVVLTAKGINPTMKIISRASNENSDFKLKRAGANNVIMPDRVGGQRMAKLVTQPDVAEFVDFIMLQEPDNVFLEELTCENLASCFDGRKISELDIRNQSGANIIGLRKADRSYIINPSQDVILSASDKLFVLGNVKQINQLRSILATEVPSDG
jgi:voltage-gated potassium channel